MRGRSDRLALPHFLQKLKKYFIIFIENKTRRKFLMPAEVLEALKVIVAYCLE